MAKSDAKGFSCVCCKRTLGDAAKVLPVFVPPADDARAKSQEVWCPSCFGYNRARLEGARFVHQAMIPVQCGDARCGVEALSPGSITCPQCGSRNALLLTARECCVPKAS
jgi:hypothetical protein